MDHPGNTDFDVKDRLAIINCAMPMQTISTKMNLRVGLGSLPKTRPALSIFPTLRR